MTRTFSRRRLLAGAGATFTATMGEVGAPAAARAEPGPDRAFRYCLNTALLRGYDLGIVEQVELAAAAGYDAVEPWVADRYRALLEVGARSGVVPQLELWGFARNLSRLAECVFAAVAADHEDACLLLDVYHLYKGGSGLEGLRLLGPHAVHVLHVNDYPSIPRATIEDKDRVLPGEGVAPLRGILGALRESRGETVLSIELFNEGYWKRWDAPTLARLGLERTKAAAAARD